MVHHRLVVIFPSLNISSLFIYLKKRKTCVLKGPICPFFFMKKDSFFFFFREEKKNFFKISLSSVLSKVSLLLFFSSIIKFSKFSIIKFSRKFSRDFARDERRRRSKETETV